MANILAKGKFDWARFSQSTFDLDLSFESKNNGELATIKGIGTRHQIQVDTDGLPFNAPNIHVSFAESVLALANPIYPIRNVTKQEDIIMKDDLVSFVDNTGTLKLYQITEVFPSQTVGMIVCMCADYDRTTNPIAPISAMSYTNNNLSYDGTGPIATMVAAVTGDLDFFKVADSDTADFAVGGLVLNRTTGDITGTLIATFSAEVLAIGKDGFTIGAVSVSQTLTPSNLWKAHEVLGPTVVPLDFHANEGVTSAVNRISAWVDRSNSISAAQGVGADQPFLLDNALQQANGNDTIGTGFDTFLEATGITPFSQPLNIFSIAELYGGDDAQTLFDGGGGTDLRVFYFPPNRQFTLVAPTLSKEFTLTDANILEGIGNLTLFHFFVSGASSKLRINGGAEISINGDCGSDGQGTTLTLPANSNNIVNWSSRVAEFMYVKGSLSTANREFIEGQMMWDWGIQTRLPSGHPYENGPPTV